MINRIQGSEEPQQGETIRLGISRHILFISRSQIPMRRLHLNPMRLNWHHEYS
jgi:hypothetical protein